VGSYSPPRAPGTTKERGSGRRPRTSYTACVVEPEVDRKTGWITVQQGVRSRTDIGRAIKPGQRAAVRSKAASTWAGRALMEEQGVPALCRPSFPTHWCTRFFAPRIQESESLDMPEVIYRARRDPDPDCPFGAKEVGRGPCCP